MMERLTADPSYTLCLTDYEGLVLGGPRDDREVQDFKIAQWRAVAANRANDFIDDRKNAGFPDDAAFEQFADDLANGAITTYYRPYTSEVPGCRGEVLRQLSVLERDPRAIAVGNTLLTTCMEVFEYCQTLPPHIELN